MAESIVNFREKLEEIDQKISNMRSRSPSKIDEIDEIFIEHSNLYPTLANLSYEAHLVAVKYRACEYLTTQLNNEIKKLDDKINSIQMTWKKCIQNPETTPWLT